MLFVIGLLISFIGNAWHGGYRGPYHGHGGGFYFGSIYPGNGFYYNNGGWRPDIVINVPPPPRYYAPACETVRICNQFDECWLERDCR